MTLVLESSAPPVRSLWAVMDHTDIAVAREALRNRERVSQKRAAEILGWSKGKSSPELIIGLPEWAASNSVEGVVWTALPSKFNGEDRRTPTMKQVLEYLGGLKGAARDAAECYIRCAPRQIDTPYRRRIAAEFQWTYQDSCRCS